MRLAPIPLFYYLSESDAIQNAGNSARFTHGDTKAIDACRFYSALFFRQHFRTRLHEGIMNIIEGSYKTKNDYADGIHGKGFMLNALEAALWAFL
jgi:ADP-ribosylglycohydrolase